MNETPQYNVGDVVNGHRWTGTEWQPVGETSTAVTPPAATPTKPWFKKWWGIGLIAFAALTVFGVAIGGGSDTDAGATDGSSASADKTPGDKGEPTDESKSEPTEELTVSQEQAVKSAESYLQTGAFSKKGLIKQLEFEGFSTADAKFAVNYGDVDWNAEAVESAENYLDTSAFSRSGLIKQLEFEGFTSKQAEGAVDSLDVDWNAEAVKSAENYLNTSAFSRSGLIDQLEFEGFTPDQAEYAADTVGL